jgi:hypothetical protein
MPDQDTTRDTADESVEDRRSRKSAREVVEWETAFAAAKEQGKAQRATGSDHANAGAIVSRAHRAEKTTVRPPKV